MARSHHKQSKEPPKKRGEYHTFDEITGAIRKAAIQSIAKKIIKHRDQRGAGNQCAPGFFKGLIDRVTETTPNLVITRNDINNEVSRLIKARQEQQQQADLPQMIPPPSNHPTLSESASSSEQYTATDEPSVILTSVLSDIDSDYNDHIMHVESHSTADEDVDLHLPSLPPPPSQSASTAEPYAATDEPSAILPLVSSDNDSDDDNDHIMSVESHSTADEDVDLAPRIRVAGLEEQPIWKWKVRKIRW